MDLNILNRLYDAYKNAPEIYQATSYWNQYEKPILDDLHKLDVNQLRSGQYTSFSSFGFNERVFSYPQGMPWLKKLLLKLVHKHIIGSKRILPYSINTDDIRDMAYRHCELYGQLTNSKPIETIETETFGNPGDLFSVRGKKYTMQFLSYYLRYCFANKHIGFRGNEIIVELGSGTGLQAEILKKLYPDSTILCFDMPAQIYISQIYLSNIFSKDIIVGVEETMDWKDLSGLRKGCVHFLGNWQFPLLQNLDYDVFWNAASFGEMEPEVVRNYLEYVIKHSAFVYLLQARFGKQKTGKAHVINPITFEDYCEYLKAFKLMENQEVFNAQSRIRHAGGYFEAVWKSVKP
jgi:putative sugar O-methyltransferase